MGLPAGREALDPEDRRWREVLDLGVALISAWLRPAKATPGDTPANEISQRRTILETTERLIGGKASLWLLPFNDPGSIADLPGSLAIPTEWMRQAMDRLQLVKSPGGFTVAVPCVYRAEIPGSRSAPDVVGALQVRRHDRPFDPQELNLLEGIALQAAQGMRALRQARTENWRIEQLGLVQQVSAQIANLRDLDEVTQRITRLILETFDYYYVAIFILNPGGEVLSCQSAWMQPARLSKTPPSERTEPALQVVPNLGVVKVGEGIIGHVARIGQELLARDVGSDTYYTYEAALPETRSELALPLQIEDRLLGVLDVQSNLPDDFSETDLLVLRALASNIALAIEGANMYAALGRRAEQLATLFEIGNTVASILDPDEMLAQVAELIHKRFGFPYIHLFTVHPGQEKINYVAGSGSRSRQLVEQGLAYDLNDPQGMIPWAARRGETIIANDVRLEPLYRPLLLSDQSPAALLAMGEDTQSEMTVPLVFGGEVLGVMDIQSKQKGAFSEDNRFLFEALAGNIAIALHNAQLYRSEQFQRRVADSLREVAGLLTTDTEVEQVLHAILKELDRTLPCDLAVIWLVDEELGALDAQSNDCPPLRLAAVNGAYDDLPLQPGISLVSATALVREHSTQSSYGASVQPAWTWLAEVLQANQPVIRQQDTPYEPLGALLDLPKDYSAIAAPLRIGDQRLGVLLMLHGTTRRYGNESRLMTAAFAGYAAVAIENARLYEAAHEQAWVSSVLLEVTRATQEIDELSELFQIVTQVTPTLTGVNACLLYLRDESGVFIPAAAYGLEPTLQADFERWKFAPGDVPALERLIQEQTPILLELGPGGAPLTGMIAGEDRPDREASHRRMILVPLVSRGEVLGTFLVEYQGGRLSPAEGEAIEDFSSQQLAIIQGIARQTALAVENLRLTRIEEEEAYVSVALLQVAQSIASNTNLNEILGTIVRLTSILIGARRAAIYLLDDRSQSYRLAQAYGLDRSADSDEDRAGYGEFPLLDALRQQPDLLACPVAAESEETQETLQGWKNLAAPDLHALGDFLAVDERLLLVFPMLAQNELLGALLVEEHGPQLEDLTRMVSSSRHLREKRLEIATGISQQAALAIQNERYQQSIVRRERIDRELQLAHDIQRSLLPPKMLEPSGWELAVLWQTAREVGGDFYDLFELPGGELGLAIGDVSDKGLPAALYMTHVHALLRAMAQNAQPPAEVLCHINDAIAGDESLGMFVTMLYGVLTPETGRLVYANAGHNPPILLRSGSARSVGVSGGGMALGVMPGQQVDQAELTLEPGDSLVLFTDGVTEAFSPQGFMFGQEQLIQVIHQSTPGAGAAHGIVQAIEEELILFRSENPPDDDLTLLVITRR